MMGYRRILAIAELDNDDVRVLRRAAQISRWSGAPLLVLHVLDYAPGFECDQAPVLTRAQVENSLNAAARDRIGALLRRLDAVAHVLVLQGKPSVIAAAVAQEWQTDLVVCSKAGRYRLDHAGRPAFGGLRSYSGELLSVRAERNGLGARLLAWLQPLRQS